jgi:hypothetical protein
MPQPLSKVAPHADVMIHGIGVRLFIEQRPKLAPYAMEVIAGWSSVEASLVQIFMRLVGGNKADAAVMYLALDGDGPKRAVFKALAEQKFSGHKQEIFKSLMKRVSSIGLERNKIAHWTWGYSPNLPDALLLVDPRDISDSYDSIFVYTEADFLSLAERLHVTSQCLSRFSWMIAPNTNKLPQDLYKWLCSELNLNHLIEI